MHETIFTKIKYTKLKEIMKEIKMMNIRGSERRKETGE